MKPIKFHEDCVVYAETQDEYNSLDVLHLEYPDRGIGHVSCWKMNFWERVRVLITGKIYVDILGFQPPIILSTDLLDWIREEGMVKPIEVIRVWWGARKDLRFSEWASYTWLTIKLILKKPPYKGSLNTSGIVPNEIVQEIINKFRGKFDEE